MQYCVNVTALKKIENRKINVFVKNAKNSYIYQQIEYVRSQTYQR